MSLRIKAVGSALSNWILQSVVRDRPLGSRAALAAVFFGGALLIESLLGELGGGQFIYPVFGAAVLSSLYAGPVVALIGAFFGVLTTSYFFIMPGYFLGTPDRLVRILIFLGQVYLMALFAATLRNGLRRFAALTRQADHARQAAEQEGAAREHTINIVSHDLRNPLASIQMYVQLLQRDSRMYEKHQAAIQTIQRSAERMNRIISDLLDAGRIDSGRFYIESKQESVSDLLAEVVNVFRPLSMRKKIELATDIKATATTLFCDRNRLVQAISNLLDNAIKFSSVGGQVLIRVTDAPGGISFIVIDEGSGIPESERGSLFRRYWRSPTNAGVEGSGLGMYIVKGIADSHGGSVAVDSAVGKGTSVSITVPLGQNPLPKRSAA